MIENFLWGVFKTLALIAAVLGLLLLWYLAAVILQQIFWGLRLEIALGIIFGVFVSAHNLVNTTD